MSDLDLSVFLCLFIDEEKELLQKLTDGLLALERDPGDKEIVAEITRAAHTLKGNAGFLELTGINKISHAMEDVLGAIRDGEAQITGELFDLLLSSRDAIEDLVDETVSEKTLPVDADQIAERLRSAAAKKETPPQPPPRGPSAETPDPGETRGKKGSPSRRRRRRIEEEPDERNLEHFRVVSGRIIEQLRAALVSLKRPSDLGKMAQSAHRVSDAAALLEIDPAVKLSDALAAALDAAAEKEELPTGKGVGLIADAIGALEGIASLEEITDLGDLADKLATLTTVAPASPVSPAEGRR